MSSQMHTYNFVEGPRIRRQNKNVSATVVSVPHGFSKRSSQHVTVFELSETNTSYSTTTSCQNRLPQTFHYWTVQRLCGNKLFYWSMRLDERKIFVTYKSGQQRAERDGSHLEVAPRSSNYLHGCPIADQQVGNSKLVVQTTFKYGITQLSCSDEMISK